MAVKPNTKLVIDYLKEVCAAGKNVTSEDVAAKVGLTKKQVDGIFTMAIQKKQLGERIPAEVALADGTHKAVKFLTLNDEGMAFDTSEVAE